MPTPNIEIAQHNPLIMLTQKEAAEQLGLKDPHTLAVWRSTKRYPELAYVKIGRSVRYSQSAVIAFIRSRTIGTSEVTARRESQ